MNKLNGKVALVTGASSGIGKAIAIAFGDHGLDVAVNYLSNKSEAEKICSQISAAGRRAFPVQADVSRAEDVSRMVAETERTLGPVLVLVNNAGIVHRDKLENLTEQDWNRVMDVNLKSAFLVTQACLAGMRAKKWGRIINISSVAAQTGGVTDPLYVTSKAGLIGLTHSYASLLVKEGITANSIAPALIDTEMGRQLKVTPAIVPVGRFGHAQEVAEAAVLLADNGYITGQTLNVNGGMYYS